MELKLEFEIRQAIQGNKDSFSNLIKRFENSMYKVAKSMLQSDDDCADAIQEAILKAYKSIDNLKEIKFFKTWLIRILINECHNINKVKSKLIPIHKIGETVCEKSIITNSDDNIEIEEVLNCLENDLKSVVMLYYFEEFSIKEISSMLGIPGGTVKSRLSRARLKLKVILKKNFQGSECYER
ncbi:RNA polymerase sigma factor [Clostridium tagluense]|uniref:RNA polymerase sigma factor n=1 Tax=Clostridium tagluense TaxID=360422 RepID=UPI001CF49573|nr:RNA polymerase sigma factor [Clostridium tagluense]MCB2311363.1 RNA polymerase sigma factor [Clostridium tagluense]MCB2315995.1 RNA polymerase sigma factor [Clostridium tagluense]MCB2320939.1 RNA polymerase sigma factor [Clostridium tagluense]MCB2325864.1 RNA polymerase sigma factor [Clostridium tagluense]MCB2330679.1 RNA polymerase sigma factor [Clostridium tagluense]